MEDPTRAHHRADQLSARQRFDEVECTISHLFRWPHPALGGRRYGEALLQSLASRGIGPGTSGVIEIGGGAGHLAEAAFRGEAGPFTRARWTSLDLSPALLAAQRLRLSGHAGWNGLRGDALDLPLRPYSVDGLVLANEVIADLPVVEGRNTGAVRFVNQLSRVLARGGAAVLTEFGGDFEPGPVRLYTTSGKGEHTEWSIDFRTLRAAASENGLEAEELPLHELLGVDLRMRCASYTDLWRLRRFTRCEVFAAPADEVRRRYPLLSRFLDLPELGSPRWPDASAQRGFAQLFRALILRKP